MLTNIEKLKKIVPICNSYNQVIAKLGGSITGNSIRHLKKRIKLLSIDTSHFYGKQYTKLGNIMVNNPSLGYRIEAKRLKKELLKNNREYKCEFCGNIGLWNDKVLTLEIDHIDGNWRNNLPENLRFLCPNCHAQTENFYNKKNQLRNKPKSKGNIDYNKIKKRGRNNVENKPNKEELEKLVWEMPTTHIAKIYNVSDKSVEKWCKKYNIEKPKRGYWANINKGKEKCPNYKRYKGKQKPRCLGGRGCESCWDKYNNKIPPIDYYE